jgi:protein deglycase
MGTRKRYLWRISFAEFGFYQDAYDERFLQVIREFKSQGKIIASVCVAALSVGKSGILSGKRGTTYNKKAARQETLRGYGVNVVNDPLVVDDNIITCWNPSSAIDVAFHLLELLTSKDNTDQIKDIMGFEAKIKPDLIAADLPQVTPPSPLPLV